MIPGIIIFMLSHRRVRLHPSRPARPLIDIFAYTFGTLSPLFTLPQIWDIFRHHDATGLSPVTWGGYLAFSIFWLTYSVYHKDTPLIIVNALWCLMHLAVVLGILLYL